MGLTSLQMKKESRTQPSRTPSRGAGAVSDCAPTSGTPTVRRRRTRKPCDSLYLRAAATSPPPCDENPLAWDRGCRHSLRKRRCFQRPFQRRRLDLEFWISERKCIIISYHENHTYGFCLFCLLVVFVFFLTAANTCLSEHHWQKQIISVDLSRKWNNMERIKLYWATMAPLTPLL